jgi:hypothetical protein
LGPVGPTDKENQVKMYKKYHLGTLPVWNGEDPDPYQIEKQDPDQKCLDPQHCSHCSVVDPKLFIPDPDPTSEKFRIRIRIRILTIFGTVYIKKNSVDLAFLYLKQHCCPENCHLIFIFYLQKMYILKTKKSKKNTQVLST